MGVGPFARKVPTAPPATCWIDTSCQTRPLCYSQAKASPRLRTNKGEEQQCIKQLVSRHFGADLDSSLPLFFLSPLFFVVTCRLLSAESWEF